VGAGFPKSESRLQDSMFLTMYHVPRKLALAMPVPPKEIAPQDLPGQRRVLTYLGRIRPLLIEVWIAAILVTFFFIRILGSQTAQRILSGLQHHRLP
jgi:hypothetical protein